MFAVRREVLLTVGALLALTLAGLYFAQYPVPGLFVRSREVATAALFLALAAGVGRAVRRVLRAGGPDDEPPLDGFVWAVGFGVPVIALSLLALGAAGGFRPAPLALLTAGLAAAAWRDLAHGGRALAAEWRRGLPTTFRPTTLLGAAAVAAALVCAFAPPTYYDSLVYHLALPAGYLREGRIGFVPYNQYAHFPQNMELVFGWFLAAGSDVAAQVFNVALALLIAAALASVAREWNMPGAAWAKVLYWTAPCTLLLSSETYVETPMAFWTLLSLWAAERGLRRGDRRQLVAAGLLGGFAAGIKYTGAITPLLLGAIAFAAPGERPWRDRARDAAAVGLPALAVFAPWLLKNYVCTGGNPFFPFFPAIFPAKNVYMHAESARAYFRVFGEYGGTSPLLVQLFTAPLKMLTDPLSLGGGYDVTGDLGWALVLIAAPFALFTRPRSGGLRFALAYTAAHGVIWASLRPVLRFLFPVFPVACLLAGTGLSTLRAGLPAWGRRLVAVLTGLFVLSNAVLFYAVERVRDPGPVAAGLLTREEYLRRKIDGYAALAFVNESLPADARLLFVGDQRGYYCRRRYLTPMALLPQPLKTWAGDAGDGDRLREKLLESGFTHVFFHRREADRLKSYGVLDFDEAGRRAWDGLTARSPRAYEDGSVTIFSLSEGNTGE